VDGNLVVRNPLCPNKATPWISQVVGLYGGMTDAAEQCGCWSTVQSWFRTTNPPTRTQTRLFGTGITVITTTISGSVITKTSAAVQTSVFTITENGLGAADGVGLTPNLDWYSTAKPPCVSVHLGRLGVCRKVLNRCLVLLLHHCRIHSRFVLFPT
jgi:hypothetical protein